MPKKAVELSAIQVKRLTKPGLHFVGGVAGLALQVAPGGARTWILRFTIGSKRREMGLGGFPDVELAQARERARKARDLIDEGKDPILQRREAKSALLAQQAADKTFKQCASAYIDSKSAGWKNEKHAAQWQSTLETYAYPKIGALLVRDVGLPQVLSVLQQPASDKDPRPFWSAKTETASRVRQRIEAVLDWATVQHYRHGLNPARWKGHLDVILPAPAKVTKVRHHRALPIDELAAFVKALRAQNGIGARALEFAILTAARSGEVRGATWPEVDLEAALWTIPGERMKAGKEHRVPLSAAAVALLKQLPQMKDSDLIFPSSAGKQLSDMTLLAVMKRMHVDAVPHGFRSTFKDWATERTGYPSEVVEMALAHTISDKVEAAYRRGDLFEKRRRLMADWAKFCETPLKGSRVTPIRSKRA